MSADRGWPQRRQFRRKCRAVRAVAKTTIYRYWPTRSALLFDAVMQFAPRLQDASHRSLRGDLTALALGLAQRLQTGRWSSAMPSIIDAAERDKEVG